MTSVGLRRWFLTAALLGSSCALWAAGNLVPKWNYYAPAAILFAPTVGWDGSVYMATDDSLIRAVSPDGQALWAVDPGGRPSAAMALQANLLYFPTSQGDLAAYGVDGRLAWRTHLGGALSTTPAIAADATVYVGAVSGRVYALGQHGVILWSFNTGDPIVTSPVIGSSGWIFVASTHNLYALNSHGIPQAITRLPEMVTSPLALDSDDNLYYVDAAGSAWSRAPQGGERWHSTGSTTLITTAASPVISAGSVVLSASFAPPPPVTYSISGTITETTGEPLSGVSVSTGVLTSISDDTGKYTLNGLASGTYTVTPTLTGFAFLPASRSVQVNGANETGKDFVATATAAPAKETGAAEDTTDTYKVGSYDRFTGNQDWPPLSIGSHFGPALSSDGTLFIPSTGDTKVYLLDRDAGDTLGILTLADAPGDMVLAETAPGPRLYLVSGTRLLLCYGTLAGPDSSAPWSQIGAGPRHLYRRDDPPSVTLTEPSAGPVSGTVDLSAAVSDDFSSGLLVRYLVDGLAIGSAEPPTYDSTWNTLLYLNGSHVVTAQVRDSAGSVSEDQVTVLVTNSAEPDTVYADSPPMTFSWSAGSETQFRVDVASDGGFQNILATSKTSGHNWLADTTWTPGSSAWKKILASAKSAGANDASFSWRVMGKTAQGPLEGAGGVVKIAGQIPPRDMTPDNGTEVSPETPPVFTWTAQHNSSFQVRLSDTREFNVVRLKSKGKKGKWITESTWTPDLKDWKKLAQTYSPLLWEVVGEDTIGRTSTSVVKSLTVVP